MTKLTSLRNIKKLFNNNIYKKKLSPTYNIKNDINWIAASKTRNAALNDHCIDYFKVYNIKDINDIPNKCIQKKNKSSKLQPNNFTTFILDNGNKFEEKIYNELCKKYGNNIIKIGESYEAHCNNKFLETYNEMLKGTPMIYQGILHNEYNKTYGSCDLIIRSDWLNTIMDKEVISESDAKIAAPLIDKPYHYRVIDIKYTKLHFNSDFKTIRNNANVKPYKCQLLLYNQALGMIQGYYSPESYILSSGWKYKGKLSNGKQLNSNNPFDRLGVISYDDKDKQYYKITEDAILWYRDLMNSSDWTHNPPCRDEIYPNMCNKYDNGYNNIKKQISNKYHDITQIWNCSITHRNLAMKQGVKSWKDPKCTTELMNITGKNKIIIDKILMCNRDETIKVYPKKIENNLCSWRETGSLEFYVDFETIIKSLFIPEKESNEEYIFMIGLGWKYDNEWNYIDFTTNNLSNEEELRIINEFINEMTILKKKYNQDNPNIYHWNFTENVIFNKVCKRHNIECDDLKWFDFLDVVKEEPIIVNGALNFSLKDFAKAMYNHGLIKTVWEDSEINNGLEAMYKAWIIYNKNERSAYDNEIIKMIKKYNEVDCKVVYEIIDYLRRNH
jgi:hypothetical protein